MLEVDSQIRMIIANLNDKLASITHECQKEQAYCGYLDEKLKSIEWDIKVLRHRIDEKLEEKQS
jgi:uncharacterized coiled-coil protein SlyX